MNKKALLLSTLLAASTGSVHAQYTNLGEVFLESSSPECVQLSFEGFAVFAKFTPSLLTGVSIRVIGSPITSNYNPDFIVNSYARLGTSPLLESMVVFGPVQNILSEPVVEALTGVEVPVSYDNYDWWAGTGSEPDDKLGVASNAKYHEVEVIGHPGNLYTALSRALRGEFPIEINLGDALLAVPRQIAGIPSTINQSAGQLGNGIRSLGGQFSGLSFDPVDVATNQFVGDLADLFSRLPQRARDTISNATSNLTSLPSEITDAWDQGSQIVNAGINALDSSVGNAAQNDPNAQPTAVNAGGVIDQVLNMDVSGLPDYIGREVTDYFSNLTLLDVVDTFAPGVAEDIQNTIDGLATMEAFAASVQGIADGAGGVGARLEPWQGLCPSDTTPMVPYYLSGMNVLAWRFKIPEIVYPQTYVPFSNATTIGNFQPLATLSGNHDGEIHNYGSVYPRNGYLLQPDPVKAAAVSAFRAAHVVTRDGQPHVYTYAEPQTRDDEFVMFDARHEDLGIGEEARSAESMELRPDLRERGSWQLIHSEGGETEQSCQLFGDPSVNPSMGNIFSPGGLLRQTPPAQWTEGKKADDNRYVFNLWRRYRCAPDPDSSGSWTEHLFNINLPHIDIIH